VGKKDKEKLRGGEEEYPRADRSADSMFRTVSNNHFRISAMADSKAHIMITICAGIIGLSVKQLFDPQLAYATMSLIATCLVTLFFAVYSTMPKLGAQEMANPSEKNFNLIFFSNFVQLPYEKFEAEMETIIRDQRLIHRSMIKDLYSLGKVLAEKKYRYLRLCYVTFLVGLAVSAIVLVVSIIIAPQA
jgi:hypothetical protein